MSTVVNILFLSCIIYADAVGSNIYFEDDTVTLFDEYTIDTDSWQDDAAWDTINTLISLKHKQIIQKCIFHSDHDICLCQFQGQYTKYLCSKAREPHPDAAKQSISNYIYDQERNYLFDPSIFDLISTIDNTLKANGKYIASYHLRNPTNYEDKSEKYLAAHVIYKNPIVLLSLTHMIDLFEPTKKSCRKRSKTAEKRQNIEYELPLPIQLQQMVDAPTLSLSDMMNMFSVSKYFVMESSDTQQRKRYKQSQHLQTMIDDIKLHIKHIIIKGKHDGHALKDLQTLINRFVGVYENHGVEIYGLRDWSQYGRFKFIGEFFLRYPILSPRYGRYFGKKGSSVMYPAWMDGVMLKFFYENVLRFHKDGTVECHHNIDVVDAAGWLNMEYFDVWKRWMLIQTIWRYLQVKLLQIPSVIQDYFENKKTYIDSDQSLRHKMKEWLHDINDETKWIRGDGRGPAGEEITTNMIDINYALRDWIKTHSSYHEKDIPKPLTAAWLEAQCENAMKRGKTYIFKNLDARDWCEMYGVMKSTLNPKEEDRYQVIDFIKEMKL